MTNLNKTYHKGKFRSYEWAKHLRPFLKRIGNKRFRKTSINLEEDELVKYRKSKKRHRKRIKAKITVQKFGDCKLSYYKSFKTVRDFNNAVNRPNVIRYFIIED